MRTTLLALSLALTALMSFPALADDSKELLSLEQRWLNAGIQRDIPALKEILADDFVDVTYNGGLRDKEDHLKSSLAPSKTHQALEELKVRFYGDTGIVTGVDHGTAADGSTAYKIRFTDVFVKRAGHWQAVSAQETPEQNP